MAAGWLFGKAPYNKERPTPAVSHWTLFFAMSELLLHPDATREALLLAAQQIRDKLRTQVLADKQAGSNGGESVAENIEPLEAQPAGVEAGAGVVRVSLRTRTSCEIGRTTTRRT